MFWVFYSFINLTRLDREQQEFVRLATLSGKGLLRVIDDILDFSRIEAGELEIRSEPFAPATLANNVCDTLLPQSREKGVALQCVIDPALPERLLGDEARLRQVLFNLVGNALKFTQEGAVQLRLELLSASGKNPVLVRFVVQDTGIGIPKEMQKVVFEPFKQVDGSLSRRYMGSGLGLGIVQGLIQRMGGSVEIESQPGEGTTVRFVIALHPVPEHETAENAAPLASFCVGCICNVLLAEDNDVNRLMAVSMLKKMGHNVVAVDNGEHVLQALEEAYFDVVLMDVQMPVLDGLEATQRIRANEREGRFSGHVPIVAVTAHALQGDKERFLDAGMDDYLAKPLDMVELDRILQKYCGRRYSG